MLSNAFAVLDKAEDRDADGFQTVGDGRRKRNQAAKQARLAPSARVAPLAYPFTPSASQLPYSGDNKR